jgi:sensor histidine kinase YesM
MKISLLQRILTAYQTPFYKVVAQHCWGITFTVFAYNTAIAGLLTLVMREESFWNNFVVSQCIGFSIAIVNTLVLGHIEPGKWRWLALCITLPTSIAIGITLALWLTGIGDWSHPYALPIVFVGLFFGIIAAIVSALFEHIEALDMEVKQRELNLVESEKRQMEAQLKMLQAQIEPHFLFNTLANVSSLIDSDPALSKRLLERLNDWLRIALVRTRSDHTTLGDELDMLENYLQILKIRFGERLRWTMDVDEDVRGSIFPPMLLQPLVENAVRHGIEPKIGGGEIVICAVINNASLHVEVNDSGVGLIGNADVGGAGLVNVRTRLATLFGEAGKLSVENNVDVGATARLELPI